MTTPEFSTKGLVTRRAREGYDVLSRIRDHVLANKREGERVSCIVVTTDSQQKIIDYWAARFPHTPTQHLPFGMYNVRFTVASIPYGMPFAVAFEPHHVRRRVPRTDRFDHNGIASRAGHIPSLKRRPRA